MTLRLLAIPLSVAEQLDQLRPRQPGGDALDRVGETIQEFVDPLVVGSFELPQL